jgi:hypothetical protein
MWILFPPGRALEKDRLGVALDLRFFQFDPLLLRMLQASSKL